MLNLKKMILFVLLFSTSSVFAWQEVFNTNIGQVVHAENFVSVGGFSSGHGMHMAVEVFNDVRMLAPINLRVDMTREQFIAAMNESGIIVQ
jgi:hypothetical protein